MDFLIFLITMKSNFVKRSITGIIFVSVLIGFTLMNPISFGALFVLISALSVNEFCNLVNKEDDVMVNNRICMLGAMYLFFAFFYQGIDTTQTAVFIPYILFILYLLISELYLKRKNPINNWAYSVLSQVYIALPFALLNVLSFHNSGESQLSEYNPILPLSIFIFSWINDTGAYCTGTLFGKHRLFERISPKKSWEGSIGGGLLSLVAALALYYFFPFMSMLAWLGLGLTVVVFGTLGDLSESLLKRHLGLKDSGNILPGHGGMLDRFDSALFAIPAAVVYIYLISMF